jgi:hypothetical protein
MAEWQKVDDYFMPNLMRMYVLRCGNTGQTHPAVVVPESINTWREVGSLKTIGFWTYSRCLEIPSLDEADKDA